MVKKAFLFMIRAYQKAISPFLPPSCRYTPSCSVYTYEAIQRFGAFRGLFIGSVRIISCNPLFNGGRDELPDDWPGFITYINQRLKKIRFRRALPPDREDEDIGSNNECH